MYRNLSVQLLNSKNENNDILDYSSQADIATTTHNYQDDNVEEDGEDEQTEDDGPDPLVEDELQNQDFYHHNYSYPHSKYNLNIQQQSQMSQRTSIDLQCDKCSIACEMIQKRDNQIKKLLEKVKRYENDLQKQRIQEEVLNISLQKKQQQIEEKDRIIAQMSRKIHYFNSQAKIQSNLKQEGLSRPQTQQAVASSKLKSSSITQQFNDQKIKKRKDSSLMDKMKTVQLVQQEVLNLKQSCVTKSQQAKAGEKLANVLFEIQQKRSSVQSYMLLNLQDSQIKSSLKQNQSSSKQKKEIQQIESYRSNQIQEEEINLPRQLYQGIDQQRKQSPMMQIEEEKKSEDEMNTSIYMEYKVPQQQNQNQNHHNFFQTNGQIKSQQQKQASKNQSSFLQNVTINPHQSNFQKIRQMVEQRNQNKSQLFRQSSKLSQSGNNNLEKRQGSDALKSDLKEQKSLTAAKNEAQQRIVIPNACKNNNLIHNMPAMKGTHLEDQFHFQINKQMQFQSNSQTNQDIDQIVEQKFIQKSDSIAFEQTESKNNFKQYEMPLQIVDKKVQIISDSEEIQESQKRPNKPINRSEYGMGGRLSNRLSQCEQKEFITNEKNDLFTFQNQSQFQSNKKKPENAVQNIIQNQISDNKIIEKMDQSNTLLLGLQIKLDQSDPTNILLSSQPGTTKSNIKIAFGISNSTARNNRLIGSNSRQIQDMMNSVMRRPKLDQNKNDDNELQNTSSFLKQQRAQNDLSVNRKGESAKSRIAGATERLGETDRDLMLDIDEEISKDSMTLPNKSMLLYSQIITQNRQIKNHFIKNTQTFILQNKYLPKQTEAILENKYFVRSLTQYKKKLDFDQIEIDRFEEQKVMNSDHLSGIQKSKNSFQIKNSNKTISRQLQQSPFNKVSEYANERVLQTFQLEKNNMTISDLQLEQTLQNTGNKNFTISGVLKRQQQQQVIVTKNKNQGQGYNNLHSSRNSLTNSSLTRLQSCAFSTNQKLFAHSKIQTSITRSEQKKNTSVISSQILKKKLQVNINSTERSQKYQNIVNKDQISSLLKKKNQISDDSQRSSEIKKDFCNTFRTIKSNVSLNRSKSKRNQPFVKSLQSQDIQQLKSGKLSTSQPKNFQKTNSLLVQSQQTQNSEFNQKVVLTGLNKVINSKADNELRIFDDFMIVGLNDNKFQNNNELVEIQNLKQRKELISHFKDIIIDNKIKIYESLEPESIWSFNHDQNLIEKCSRRKVIKNFCFPEGVKIAKIESLKQIEDGILTNYGINKKKIDNDQNQSKQDDQEPFLQFKEPFLFIFTLNKEEQAKKIKKKYIEQRKVSQVEQDMVMPGLPQNMPQNFQYRPSSRAERDISNLNSNQNSNMRSQIMDSNFNEDEQLEQNFDGFNNEPFMYCLCLRFDVLIVKNKDEVMNDTHKLQESLDQLNNQQQKNQNNHISKKELLDLIKDDNVYITQQAFCCMFSNNQLFDVIGQFMMKFYQLFALQINDKIRSNDYSGLFSMSREINLNIQLKQIIQEMHEIQLHNCLRGKDAEIQMIQFGKSVQSLLKNRCSGRRHFIEKGNNFNNYIGSISKINFSLPMTIGEIVFQQNYIFYEIIFKLMSSNDIVNLLKAILLEKTIIFVGDEHMLAQFILGFNSLISPFKWCFSLIPILPVALLDMLEAPVPLIVGITPFEYHLLVQENILENDMDQKIWVHIQLNEVTISNQTNYLPLTIQNLKSQLDQYLIDQNHSIYEPETCYFGNLYKKLEETPEKDVDKKVKEIQKVIGNIVSKDIIEKLQEAISFTENEVTDQEMKQMVQKCDYITRQFHHDEAYYKNNKWGDYEFINQFTKTQIFATLMDQFIDNKKNQSRLSLI